MEAAVEAGAEDLSDEGDQWVVTSAPHGSRRRARRACRRRAWNRSRPSWPWCPLDHGAGRPRRLRPPKVLRLLEALDDHDDVQNVWSNFDIPDEVLAAAAAD